MGRSETDRLAVRGLMGGTLQADDPRCCNVRPRSSAYGYPYCPHGSRGPIWLCPSCDKSSRAYNSDVGYDSQIVTSGGGVTRQTVLAHGGVVLTGGRRGVERDVFR